MWPLALVLVVTLADGVLAQKKAEGAVAPYTISSVKVIPYDRASDSFSDEIPVENDGFLNELDTSLFVKVEISGAPGEIASEPRMARVTVREGAKRIVAHDTLIGILNEKGKYYAPVWVYGPLCDTVTIEVSIVGQAKPATVKRTIRFNCGE